MSTVDKALETQLSNIETKTGLTRAELSERILSEGLAKHGEMVKWVKETLDLGHGDANTLVHIARQSAAPTSKATDSDPLSALYTEKKAHLRPIHDRLMQEIKTFGAFEEAPKKTYISLRRKKQFAMLGPKTNTRFELGLNLKAELSHPLLKAEPPGRMCQYIVSL